MNQRQLLLQAILDNPADDMARLVFADWLEENGEEARAEFIRTQIQLHHSRCCLAEEGEDAYKTYCNDTECLHCQLDSQSDEILGYKSIVLGEVPVNETNMGKWLGSANSCLVNEGDEAFWQRGFIAELTTSSADWFSHHAAILAEHPVEVVNLTDCPELRLDDGVLFFPTIGKSKSIPVAHRMFLLAKSFGSLVSNVLRLWWPRITFYLPD